MGVVELVLCILGKWESVKIIIRGGGMEGRLVCMEKEWRMDWSFREKRNVM